MEHWTLAWSRLLEITPNANLVIPDFSGVYRLSYKSNDGNIYVFYVGQSENLRERVSYHNSPSETNPCISRYFNSRTCYVRYARINAGEVRDGAEKFLYKHYNPACNLMLPSGPELIINLE